MGERVEYAGKVPHPQALLDVTKVTIEKARAGEPTFGPRTKSAFLNGDAALTAVARVPECGITSFGRRGSPYFRGYVGGPAASRPTRARSWRASGR